MSGTLIGTVGELVRAKTILREDVEKAAASLFDGTAVLPIKDGHGLVMPEFKSLTAFHREAIMTVLLLAKAAKT